MYVHTHTTYVCTLHKYGTSTLPVILLVNLRTHGFVQVPQARGQQRSLINVHTSVICIHLHKYIHTYIRYSRKI